MRNREKMNALRSGLVVIGALAFGYLTLQLGFKPVLERAQKEQQQKDLLLIQQQQQQQQESEEKSSEDFFD